MNTLKPFHESIVDAINRAQSPVAIRTLAQLIKGTEIPKGHKKIVKAWKKKVGEGGLCEHRICDFLKEQRAQKAGVGGTNRREKTSAA